MAKKTNPEVEVNEEEAFEEFEPEVEVIEEQPKTEPKKKTTVKSVLKKIGAGVGIGALMGMAYLLGARTSKKSDECLYLETTEKEEESEPIEITEF